MCALAWAYLVYLAGDMSAMTPGMAAMNMAVPAYQIWGLSDFTAMFAMWSVMMVAMMLHSATPMILLYAKINRNRMLQGRTGEPVGLFIGGYLLVWIGFSVFPTLLNWGLHLGGVI